MDSKERRDISIVLSGEAGQGIQTLERLLLRLFKLTGYYVFSYSEFMSRIRGGNNSTEIRLSSGRVAAFIERIDLFVPFGKGSMDRFRERISPRTVIIGDPAHIDEAYRDGQHQLFEIPLAEIAQSSGGQVYATIIITGLFAFLFDLEIDFVEEQIRAIFTKSSDEVLAKNIAAAHKGYELGRDMPRLNAVKLAPPIPPQPAAGLLLNGAEAIGMGGLAGGCNFVSSYPMSPSTDVLVFFARNAAQFGLVVEQAEDEIAAVNMAIGSWYAGGRAMVTTSGGGFALMVEAMSLAGMLESPLVVHLGQRPGPATGLPTRTEQGDLLFALFSGHGEFPRAIFAPGDLGEAVLLTRRAFYIADKYQIPVIILTDQFLIDSNYSIPVPDLGGDEDERFIVKTDADYARYRITGSGISPRGIPGYGKGIVCVDSDEHDEEGYITEDTAMRRNMVEKRMRKLAAMEQDVLPPRLYGPREFEYLIACWGSTLGPVREAVSLSGRSDMATIHFPQVYPLHPDAARILGRAKKRILIEQNATSQFGSLIRLFTGMQFEHTILKYDGMPFGADRLAEQIASLH